MHLKKAPRLGLKVVGDAISRWWIPGSFGSIEVVTLQVGLGGFLFFMLYFYISMAQAQAS